MRAKLFSTLNKSVCFTHKRQAMQPTLQFARVVLPFSLLLHATVIIFSCEKGTIVIRFRGQALEHAVQPVHFS